MGKRLLLWGISIASMMLAFALSAITYLPPGPGVFIESVLPMILLIGAILSGITAISIKTPSPTQSLPRWPMLVLDSIVILIVVAQLLVSVIVLILLLIG